MIWPVKARRWLDCLVHDWIDSGARRRDKVRHTLISAIATVGAFRSRLERQIVYVSGRRSGSFLELHTFEIFPLRDDHSCSITCSCGELFSRIFNVLRLLF